MSQLSLDIRTVIALLFLGNLIAAGVLVAYPNKEGIVRPYRQFIAGKVLQAAAWALLFLRGEIPDLYSAQLGNAILFAGFALEVSAISIAGPAQRRMEKLYALVAGCATLVFWLLAETPSERVALASITTIALFGTASAVMLRTANASRLRRVIAYLYAGFCLVLVFRSGFALLTPSGIGLMTGNLIQTVAFLVLFLMALAGGIGFLLLIKEDSDRLLSDSEARHRLLAENSHDVIWTLDLQTQRFGYVSPSVERLRGYTPAEVMEQPVAAALTPASARTVETAMSAMLAQIAAGERANLTSVTEVDQPHRDGHIIHTEVVTTYLLDRDGKPVSVLGITRDITARKQAEQALERLAQTDPLTGLANRRHFMTLAEQELARMLRYGGPLSVFMMDIDHFKDVNDTYGHQTGDLVLQKLGTLFRDALRDVDCVGRVGGEEFAVVLPQTDGQRALEVAERLRSAVANFEVPLAQGLPLRVSLSIGVSTLVGGGVNLDTVLGQADRALYEAKRSGRNRISVFGRPDPAPVEKRG